MTKSPLRVERYFFTKAQLVAAENFDAKAVNNINTKISCEKGTRTQDSKNPEKFFDKYRITLKVALLPLDQNTPAYTGEFEIVGHFRVFHDGKQGCDGFAAANGASILYGAVREMVANLSARGPWPILGMVLVSFTDLAKKLEEKEKSPKRSTEQDKLATRVVARASGKKSSTKRLNPPQAAKNDSLRKR